MREDRDISGIRMCDVKSTKNQLMLKKSFGELDKYIKAEQQRLIVLKPDKHVKIP